MVDELLNGKVQVRPGRRATHDMSIIRRHPSVKVTSAGGVEDTAHPGSLTNQDIVFGHSLLCLQNSDGDALLFQEVQRGGLHLGERNTYI